MRGLSPTATQCATRSGEGKPSERPERVGRGQTHPHAHQAVTVRSRGRRPRDQTGCDARITAAGCCARGDRRGILNPKLIAREAHPRQAGRQDEHDGREGHGKLGGDATSIAPRPLNPESTEHFARDR